MAKRGILEHPKTLRLARLLKVQPWAAVGLLECTWHWCARYAITGEIKAAPEDLADGIRYTDDPQELFEAFVSSGYFERLPDGRTVVHDVSDHADNTWKQNLKDAGLTWWNGATPFKTKASGSPEPCETLTSRSQAAHKPLPSVSPQPEPEPEPEPEPLLARTPDDESLPNRLWEPFSRIPAFANGVAKAQKEGLARLVKEFPGMSPPEIVSHAEACAAHWATDPWYASKGTTRSDSAPTRLRNWLKTELGKSPPARANPPSSPYAHLPLAKDAKVPQIPK